LTELTDDEKLAQILNQAGYKYTKPRQVVASVLLNTHGHLSAPEVVDAALEADPSIGRMSVYRTLDLFTRLGLIRPAFQEGTIARYVVMVGGHHHHIICQGCGRVIHFDQCPLDELTSYLRQKYHCEINGHLLEFFGRCEDCLKKLN
jgi:Fur family transcriptional regulator, ferric uptake regulator